MEYLKIRNWGTYQHYKHRNPPWIRLYANTITSEDWVNSDDATKVDMVAALLLGAQKDGMVPADPDYFARIANLDRPANLNALVDNGFLEDASNVLATCAQHARQKEREQKERKNEVSSDTSPRTTSSEVSEQPDSSILDFPVVGKPNVWGLSRTKALEWHDAYGERLNVWAELKKARQWLRDTPKKRKTARGMTRFLNGWLTRAVDSGNAAPPLTKAERRAQRERLQAARRADEEQARRARVANGRDEEMDATAATAILHQVIDQVRDTRGTV